MATTSPHEALHAAAGQQQAMSMTSAGVSPYCMQGLQLARVFTPAAYQPSDYTLAWEPLDPASLPAAPHPTR